MSRPSTIKDIAAHVGVSSMAVSAVLGRSASGTARVSEATRARILEAARALEYRPNRIARALRSQKTNVIGVYTAYGYLYPYASFTSQVIGGLHLGCDENHKDLLLHGLYQGRSTEDIYGELADGRVDGLVLYTSPEDPLVERLVSSSLPVIAVIDALPGLPSVVADDAGGSGLLAAYLAAQGHRSVFYRPGRNRLVSAVRRHEAFLAAAATHGLEVVESRVQDGHEKFEEGELDWLALPRSHRPTAAVCWNDQTAYNLLEHCRARGVPVPTGLAVVGFDGLPPSHPTPWRLTTIRAPWVEVTRTAVSLLVSRISGAQTPVETILPVEFVSGNTA